MRRDSVSVKLSMTGSEFLSELSQTVSKGYKNFGSGMLWVPYYEWIQGQMYFDPLHVVVQYHSGANVTGTNGSLTRSQGEARSSWKPLDRALSSRSKKTCGIRGPTVVCP